MSIEMEKRHFFRFPKEHDRWLEWIKASKRLDLELKGPNYAYNNCTLCHLHFEEKWLRRTTVIRLHPDAVPTIFFGPAFDRENVDKKTEEVNNKEIEEPSNDKMEVTNNEEMIALVEDKNERDVQYLMDANIDVDARPEPSTSGSMPRRKNNSSSPSKKKLHMKIAKLKRQNNKLRQMVRRLRQGKQKRTTVKQENNIENMRQLSSKLFSGNFLQLLSVQIDTLTKNKRGNV